MMMASTNGISLVMRQNLPEYFDMPAAIFFRCAARKPSQVFIDWKKSELFFD